MSQEHSGTFDPLLERGSGPASTVAAAAAYGRRHERSVFPSALALGMLVVILVGFGPTFFLRAFFDVPEIPYYLLVHGAMSATWFVLLFVQTRLVASGRTALHRSLGIAGAVVALAMLVSGIQTSLGMIPRRLAAGIHVDAAELEFLGFIASANFAFFVAFPTLIALALWYRRRVDVHRRLMLVASVTILGPAAIRIASWFGDVPNPIVPVIIFGFLGAVIANDVVTRRRPHAATIAAAVFALGLNGVFQLIGVGDAVLAYQIARYGG
jgi:hypothetical protein